MAASNGQQQATGLQISGGAAIVAPVSAFPNGVPGNALIVIPMSKPSDELKEMLEKGPAAVTMEQMWKLLGFNGPAVQVQDESSAEPNDSGSGRDERTVVDRPEREPSPAAEARPALNGLHLSQPTENLRPAPRRFGGHVRLTVVPRNGS